MAAIYIEYEKVATCTIKLTKGKHEDETITLNAMWERNGAAETKTIEDNIQVTEAGVSFEFDTHGLLRDNEMFLPVKLLLTVSSKGGTPSYSGPSQWKMVPVVIYRPTLEVTGVDHEDKPLPGAECRLTIAVDEGFRASNQKWREDFKIDRRGNYEWIGKTEANGKITFSHLPLGQITLDWVPPHALRDPGSWKTAGGFTSTGPKRKAVIRKLPIVHYIWWGNPTAAEHLTSATTTPNAMAALEEHSVAPLPSGEVAAISRPKALVMYWRQHDANTLAGRLHANIHQQPINRLSDLMREQGVAVHPVLMGRGAQMDNVIAAMSQYKFYSAVKDLISLCVMLKHGGYYFDTTTLMPKKDPDNLPKTLADEVPDDIRFPSTASGGAYKFYRHDFSPFGTLFANTGALDDEKVYWTSNLDVWAMYAPPRHPAVAMMIDAYLKRSVAFGLDQYPNNTSLVFPEAYPYGWNPDWDGPFHQFVNVHCKPENAATKMRNRIIGNLIISSVQEGLTNYVYEFKGRPAKNYGTVNPEINAFLWKTEFATEELKSKYPGIRVQAYLPEFHNMPKAHSGSWRRVDAPIAATV